MQVKHVLFVIYCAVPVSLHVADSQEYCSFLGEEDQYEHCSPPGVNHTLDYVPRISHRITFLDLSDQLLKQLPRNAFGNITIRNELQIINIAFCKIQHIDADAFENLHSLEDLNIIGNRISRFDTGTFQHTKKLQKLSTAFNRIEILQTGLFHNLIYLREASFENNRITCIDNDTFRNTPSLSQIDLRINKLEYLSPLFTDNLINITDLIIGGNPWTCDCNLREFHEKAKVRKPTYWDSKIICQNPPRIRGREWTELTNEAFNCDAEIIVPKNDTRMVTLGTNVTLTCAVFGDHVSDIEWRRGSHIIARYNGVGKVKSLGHHLNYTFTVQEEDLGVYSCFLHNTAGIEKASTTLTTNVTTN